MYLKLCRSLTQPRIHFLRAWACHGMMGRRSSRPITFENLKNYRHFWRFFTPLITPLSGLKSIFNLKLSKVDEVDTNARTRQQSVDWTPCNLWKQFCRVSLGLRSISRRLKFVKFCSTPCLNSHKRQEIRSVYKIIQKFIKRESQEGSGFTRVRKFSQSSNFGSFWPEKCGIKISISL